MHMAETMLIAVFTESYAAHYDLFYQDKDYAGEARFVLQLAKDQGVRFGRPINALTSLTRRRQLPLTPMQQSSFWTR